MTYRAQLLNQIGIISPCHSSEEAAPWVSLRENPRMRKEGIGVRLWILVLCGNETVVRSYLNKSRKDAGF